MAEMSENEMDVYGSIAEELAEFSALEKDLKNKHTPIHVLGVSDSVRAHLIYSACQVMNRPALVVMADEDEARRMYEDLQFFFGKDAMLFPKVDLLFYDVEAKGQDVTQSRLQVLRRMTERDGASCVITTAEALCSVTVPVSVCRDEKICLKVGQDVEMDGLAEQLVRLGYCREEMVEGRGQFSIRGGILDIYPCTNQEHPVRIEFFDTEVDSIRMFEAENQRTIDRMEQVEIYPAREILLDAEQRENLIEALTKIQQKAQKKEEEREARVAQSLGRDIERLKQGMLFPSIDKYIPYLYGKKPTLLDYLAEDSLVFWDNPVRIHEQMNQAEARQEEVLCDLAERGVLWDAKGGYTLAYDELLGDLGRYSVVEMSGISYGSPDFRPVRTHTISAKSLNGFQGKLDFLCEALHHYQREIYRTIILAGSQIRAENLAKQLENEGIRCVFQQELSSLPNPGGIIITTGSIHRGFEYPLIRTVVIGDREIFGDQKRKKRKRYIGRKGDKIASFTDLNPGDYVVHQNHGIGRYVGIEQLRVDGVRKDYLKLQYQGSDVLYVPAEQLDMVYKHTPGEKARVKLNKLGGVEWSRTKERVKAAAADMAKELIALYAQRTQIQGISFDRDTEWQQNFEAAFPYEETGDQLQSIAEVKADMELPHPMDRLLCGDVGYGKTEVAMRAAFKAVMSGYQVAYLVPTTILATQHYQNFCQRMKEYPISVGMLSRFVTSTQQKKVLQGLETGEIDVVIGTHKLLGKAVKFRKLGLLVIDEEQRFGVAHKEKIKTLKKEVDVLTLSATPIPRTLHMSLSGIRDMSILSEPPGERYPVATYVLEYDENVVREAILKEMGRGGQVYYLFNRVEGIYRAANRLAELVPQARIAVAHGKMNERELEEIMQEVSQGEIDILVCTTIIETGLDIANVNTIIIEQADRLGLAQLYQLRGRVGRSNRLAYAYLTFQRNKVLTQEAEKRLLAIKEFTEFGSGFQVAMRDLEIRGTGNLIGPQQHGNMESVGYEMYCQLLEQAVKQQQGKQVEEQIETRIDLPVSGFIPEEYIQSHHQRIGAYKRIAAIENQEALYDAYDEIEDRYGTVPTQVQNLMEVAHIKALARRCGIVEMIGSGSQIVFRFDEKKIPEPDRLLALMEKSQGQCFFPNPEKPKLYYKLGKPEPEKEATYFAKIREVILSMLLKPEENMNEM